MENGYQFRAVSASAGAYGCGCGRCKKVAAIKDSPLGGRHTETQLRAMSDDRLVELTVEATTAKAKKAKKAKKRTTKRVAYPKAPDAYGLAALDAARDPDRGGLEGEPEPVDPGTDANGYPLAPDPYNLAGLAALRKAKGGSR